MLHLVLLVEREALYFPHGRVKVIEGMHLHVPEFDRDLVGCNESVRADNPHIEHTAGVGSKAHFRVSEVGSGHDGIPVDGE